MDTPGQKRSQGCNTNWMDAQGPFWERHFFFATADVCAHFVYRENDFLRRRRVCAGRQSRAAWADPQALATLPGFHMRSRARSHSASGSFPRAHMQKIGSLKLWGWESTWRFRVKSGYALTPHSEAKACRVGKGQGSSTKTTFFLPNFFNTFFKWT